MFAREAAACQAIREKRDRLDKICNSLENKKVGSCEPFKLQMISLDKELIKNCAIAPNYDFGDAVEQPTIELNQCSTDSGAEQYYDYTEQKCVTPPIIHNGDETVPVNDSGPENNNNSNPGNNETNPDDKVCPRPESVCKGYPEKKWSVGLAQDITTQKYISKVNKAIDTALKTTPFNFQIDPPQIFGDYEYGEECCAVCRPDLPATGGYHKLEGGLTIGARATLGVDGKANWDNELTMFGYGIRYELSADAWGGVALKFELKASATGQYSFECEQGCATIGGTGSAVLQTGVEAKVKKAEFEIIGGGDEYEVIELKDGAASAVVQFGGLSIDARLNKGTGCGTDDCAYNIEPGLLIVSLTGTIDMFGEWIDDVSLPDDLNVQIGLWNAFGGECL